MTVVFGRGAGTLLRAAIFGTFAVVGLVTGGCGNGTVVYGTAVMTVTNTAPNPFKSYLVYVDTITLTRSDGVVVEPLAIAERIDFARLNDMSELLGAPAVPTGTYTSATITIDYTSATVAVDVNGQTQAATVVDSAGAAVGQVSYTLKFDPAHPLVLSRYTSVPLGINFDLSASTIVNSSVSPIQVAVKPFMTMSTQPVDTRPIRMRGAFVAADKNANTFDMNSRPFFDEGLTHADFGAVSVQTSATTTYNINGVSYLGPAGLAILATLPVTTVVGAYGSFTSLSAITPTFNATQVYAGISLDSELEDRISGTVTARTGNTLNLHGGLVFDHLGAVAFVADMPLTVADTSIVSVDGQPNATGITANSISIGQKVDIGGIVTKDATTLLYTSFDATNGLIRLSSTPVWGTLNSGVTAATAPVNVLTLGEYEPAVLNFAGTGAASGANSDPTNYVVTTGSTDESATAAGSLIRFDGFVTPFGTAPPDFTANTVTLGTAVEQVMVIEWTNGGATAPFSSSGSSGLVVNIANANLGAVHSVQTGPTSIDLTNPAVNPTIAFDGARTNQLAIGNPANGIEVFNDPASFLTQIGSTLNGTNALQKLVAVGHYNPTGSVFTAYRIDLVQQ